MEAVAEVLKAWPVPTGLMVVAALVLFRKPLSGLIERASRLKTPGGVEITTAAKQDEASAARTTEAVAPIAAAAMPQPLIKFQSVLVSRVAEDLQKRVDSQFRDNVTAREKYLIDIAADAIAAVAYDYVYTLIYGSQLIALRDLNSAGAVPIAAVKPYFDTAKDRFSTLYESDTFERWLGWLIEVAYLVERREADHVAISEVGRDFLQFVISRGYVFSKNG